MDHAQIKELIPLKALSRLEGDEARAVDEHLAAGCDECERELASFNEGLPPLAIDDRPSRARTTMNSSVFSAEQRYCTSHPSNAFS